MRKTIKLFQYISLLIVSSLLAFCSGDYLSPEPQSGIQGEGFIQSDKELEEASVAMYNAIQGVNSTNANDNHSIQVEFYLTEMRSDNTETKSTEGEAAQFENFQIDPANGIVYDYYRSFYNIIFLANTVLANLGVASEANKAKIEGEAKFVRAYAYFNLVRLFGDIPLVDKVIGIENTDIQFTRVATDNVYKLIVSDLEAAVASLDDKERTRATKTAARALLAKVHLTLGNYTEAKTLCDAVIANTNYSLEPNFKDVFYKEKNNSERIFSISYISNDPNNSQNFSAEWLNAVGRTSGVNYATPNVVNAFTTAKDSIRARYSYRVDKLQTEKYQVVKYLPNGDTSLGIDPTSSVPTQAGNDWIVIRLADVLLMHVEAIIGEGSSTTDADALKSYNKIRTRAGLPNVASVTKQELLEERRLELAFENHRFFDLLRFGSAINVLTAFSSANGYRFTSTDLLLPIPQTEIGLSKGKMTQNPGY